MEPINSLEEPVDPTVHDTNETRLWRAVVLQALVDATESDSAVGTSAALARDRARAWFFAVSASTAENFEGVCDLADLNPFAVRSIVQRCLTEGRKINRAQLTAALRVPDHTD
jgi:hypothetical protein